MLKLSPCFILLDIQIIPPSSFLKKTQLMPKYDDAPILTKIIPAIINTPKNNQIIAAPKASSIFLKKIIPFRNYFCVLSLF
jgi:hypothetical protein